MSSPSLLDVLLRPGSLQAVFQPIFALGEDRGVRFVEGLIRGPFGTNAREASVLFEYVRRKGKEVEFDRLCVRQVVASAAGLPAGLGLSVNIHASTLEYDRSFPDFLLHLAEASGIPAPGLIVEIVEHGQGFSGAGFSAAVRSLRDRGVGVALDDVGCGQSSYRRMLDCQPQYFKVDRYLVHGCHGDPRRQAILDSIAGLARTFSSRVVAEGVERTADLETLRQLEIDFAQGFLLAEPGPASWLAVWSTDVSGYTPAISAVAAPPE
ncbi:MAG TPA: EAL domain-containing protein [Thermoanaerobaculia bacterium]|nr:EAL domain-containing protein [Thermoanaerobaculia bacterium]